MPKSCIGPQSDDFEKLLREVIREETARLATKEDIATLERCVELLEQHTAEAFERVEIQLLEIRRELDVRDPLNKAFDILTDHGTRIAAIEGCLDAAPAVAG